METPSVRNIHAFRPRYPLDPHTDVSAFASTSRAMLRPTMDLHDPWLLKLEHIPSSQELQRDVILVLTTFPDRSLDSLLSFPALAHSLVIIVSHETLPLSPSYTPTIRILHLSTPLSVDDTGSVRLVRILAWAERVARIWRSYGSHGMDVVDFDESQINDPVPAPRPAGTRPSSFHSSYTSPGKASSTTISRRLSKLAVHRNSSLGPPPSPILLDLPPVDPSQRPFDAIINYISNDLAEKQILKETILITSITRPYLGSTLSPYHKLSQDKRKEGSRNKSMDNFKNNVASSYSSLLSPIHTSGESLSPVSSMISVASSSTFVAPTRFAHMIHILHQETRHNLIQSLDAFLSAFSLSNSYDNTTHARQYLMHGSTLCDTAPHLTEHEQNTWTVAELIFRGSLDDIHGKTWIGFGGDVLLLPQSANPSACGPVYPTSNRSVSDHNSSIRAHAKLSVTIAAGRAPVRRSNRNARGCLAPPTLPRSMSNSAPGKTGPQLYISHHQEHNSEAVYDARKHSEPLNSTLRGASPSAVSALDGVTISSRKGSRKIRQRSKLNMIVELGDHEAVNSMSLPDSDSSEDSIRKAEGSPSGDIDYRTRKSRWRFWKHT